MRRVVYAARSGAAKRLEADKDFYVLACRIWSYFKSVYPGVIPLHLNAYASGIADACSQRFR